MSIQRLVRIIRVAANICRRHGEYGVKSEEALVREVACGLMDGLLDVGAWSAFEDSHPRQAAELLQMAGMDPEKHLDPPNLARARGRRTRGSSGGSREDA